MYHTIVVGDLGAKGVAGAPLEVRQGDIEFDLPLAYRRVDLDVGDAGAFGGPAQIDVAAQATPGDASFHLPRRGRVVVGEHDAFEGHGDDEHTQNMLATGATGCREIDLSLGKTDGADTVRVDIDVRIRVDTLRGEHDPAVIPFLWDGDLALVPGGPDSIQSLAPPTRVGENRLAILLHVVADPRPATRDQKIAPVAGRHLGCLLTGRLPAPKAVDADSLAGLGGLVLCLA